MDCWRKIIELQPEFVDAYCHRVLNSEAEDLLEIAKVACARFLQALKQNDKGRSLSSFMAHLFFTWEMFYLSMEESSKLKSIINKLYKLSRRK